MKQLVISEHGRIWKRPDKDLPRDIQPDRVYLDSRRYGLLQRFDRLHARGGKNIFTWYADHAKAMQWVGVIQLGRMQIEILPKIDDHEPTIGDQWGQTRQNLLYMLSVAGDIPIRYRDIASLTVRKAPLNETLCAIFARYLLTELLRGAERTYITREKNLRTFKGRLIINRHILKNAGHRERFIAAFIKQKVMKQFTDYEIFPQAKFNRRYLFQSKTGKKILQMAPDILIRDPEGNHLVIDTKWKRLKSDNLKSQSNVSSSDLYQLYAYTHRYGCRQSILLYCFRFYKKRWTICCFQGRGMNYLNLRRSPGYEYQTPA